MFKAVTRFFSGRPRWFILTFSIAVMGILGLLDYATGPEIRFFILYWPPIAVVAWFLGDRWGYCLVALAGLTWTLANPSSSFLAGRLPIYLWNLAANIGSFAFLAYAIVRLEEHVRLQESAARTDFLTGVSNTRAFIERLGEEIERCSRSGTPLSLAYFDLDDFKDLNDRFGHQSGDAVLQHLGETLRAALRSGDTAARLGGDEFALLLPGAGLQEAHSILDRVVAAMKEGAQPPERVITFSTGIVIWEGGSHSPEEMIRTADRLMYEAKRAGKRRCSQGVLSE